MGRESFFGHHAHIAFAQPITIPDCSFLPQHKVGILGINSDSSALSRTIRQHGDVYTCTCILGFLFIVSKQKTKPFFFFLCDFKLTPKDILGISFPFNLEAEKRSS